MLGFSNRLSTWDAALDFYLGMISTTRRALDRWHSEWALENGPAHTEPVDMTIISDSIIQGAPQVRGDSSSRMPGSETNT